MKITPELEKDFPAEFEGQCAYLRRMCSCGTRLYKGQYTCPVCKAPRARCKQKAMTDEDVCRTHVTTRSLSIYNYLAGQLGDQSMEELVLSTEGNDISGEFALAKAALARMLSDETKPPSPKQLLSELKTFFSIAEKYKRVTVGDELHVNMNDAMVLAIRKKFRKFAQVLQDVLVENIPDADLRAKIQRDLQQRTRMPGNPSTFRIKKDTSTDE